MTLSLYLSVAFNGNDEDRMWKEAAVAWYEVLFWYLPEEPEKNHRKSQ
jgi:hypothetical protein